MMEVHASKSEKPGVVYRTQCQNPGCGHSFDLRITPKDVGLLSGTLPCPHCKRHGGMLKRTGRIREKLFSAKLTFKGIGVSYSGAPGEEGDLLSDIAGSAY